MSSTAATVPIILGAAKFGRPDAIADESLAQRLVDLAAECGCTALDTARIYEGGASEKMIARLERRSLAVDTKLYPGEGGLKPEKLRAQVAESLAALNGVPIRVLYWHAPDRLTPFEESLEAMNELHKQGVFQEFGLSNALSWEVAEVVTICRERGWVRPTVYQGIYNALDRVIEDELLPCLRKFGIRFAAYSPLAGGILTGFHLNSPEALDKNKRFNPAHPGISGFYRPRYAHSAPTLQRVKVLAERHGLTLEECGVRWIVYHSKMTPEDHGVIYGASTTERLQSVLSHHAKGPLPEEIVKEFEESWTNELKGWVPSYSPIT
ncbi:aflatoxin B1-aldehyde reductase [Vararia minispora EC-137]|uniref:Aflatoxin B1-aldehyde reductase n=1 Tax=Vararia minispora EC-137 TaxID=1314806 RepID=A0ACB8Q5S9_9AGAM|nr:aflatoxin B1-aldehyde reductase [Vararia minispora EC-137]